MHRDDGVITERHARAYAAQHDMPYVSPYNDLDVVGRAVLVSSWHGSALIWMQYSLLSVAAA